MQPWWSLTHVVHDREDKVCKNGGRSWIQVEADTEKDIQHDMVVDQGPTNAVDKVHHYIETQHHTACVSDADELLERKI